MKNTQPRFEFGSGPSPGGWVRWLAWLALAGAALALVALADHASALDTELDVLRARNQLLAERLRPASARKVPPKPDADELRRIELANGAIDKLAVPWDDLLGSLEAIRVPHIGLLSLVPNAQERSMRLSGEARSVPDLMGYVERITALPLLAQVHLLGYETVPRDGAQVISFTLAARWQPR
jgi:hypothetical protein